MAEPDFKLKCKRGAFGDMLICRWTCPKGGTTGMFRARYRKDWFVIIHPSTKTKGMWQATHFDDDGPIGDVERTTCEQALYDMGVDRSWRLAKRSEMGLDAAREAMASSAACSLPASGVPFTSTAMAMPSARRRPRPSSPRFIRRTA